MGSKDASQCGRPACLNHGPMVEQPIELLSSFTYSRIYLIALSLVATLECKPHFSLPLWRRRHFSVSNQRKEERPPLQRTVVVVIVTSGFEEHPNAVDRLG